MGLKTVIVWSLSGPLIIYGLLMIHVIYQHGFKVPNPLPKPQWPNHVKEDLKQAIIANRKYIIQDLKDVFSSKLDYNKFLKNRATDDISFEDPLERIDGAVEFGHFLSMCKYLDNFEFKVHHEIHSAHEILLDWDIKFGIKAFPSIRMSIPMRTHMMMEPPQKAGEPEKIFRIFEDWFGNEQLTERSSKIPYLGKIHQSLRRFMGTLVVWPVKQGYL